MIEDLFFDCDINIKQNDIFCFYLSFFALEMAILFYLRANCMQSICVSISIVVYLIDYLGSSDWNGLLLIVRIA